MVKIFGSQVSKKGRSLKPKGRRRRVGGSYVIPHRNKSLTVTNVGRSIRKDTHKKVGSSRIPKTRTGRSKVGYGHKGDYPKKKKGILGR